MCFLTPPGLKNLGSLKKLSRLSRNYVEQSDTQKYSGTVNRRVPIQARSRKMVVIIKKTCFVTARGSELVLDFFLKT
jgi:hypothetical protein